METIDLSEYDGKYKITILYNDTIGFAQFMWLWNCE